MNAWRAVGTCAGSSLRPIWSNPFELTSFPEGDIFHYAEFRAAASVQADLGRFASSSQ